MGLKALGSGQDAAVWVVGDPAEVGGTVVVSRCPASGSTCASMTGSIPSATLWSSIDGYTDSSGVEHVFIGAFSSPPDGPNYHVPVYRIDRSTGGGTVTRTPLPASSAGVHLEINGGSQKWWVITDTPPGPSPPNTSHPGDRMGYRTYQASQLVVDPSTIGSPASLRLVAAGRAGAWRSTNAGADWYPIPNGIGATINRHVLLDPGAPLKVAVSDTDRAVIWSTDGMLNDQPTASEPALKDSAYGMAVDAAGVYYLGLGLRDLTGGGGIYRNVDVFGSGSSWVSLGMPTGPVDPLTNPVIGLSAHQVGSSTRKLAVLYNDQVGRGLYYTDAATGGWQPATITTATPNIGESTAQLRVDFAWQPNCTSTSCWVFLFDPASGLWRSTNSGVTWTRVNSTTSSGAQFVGFMAGDPVQNVLYISYGPTAYKVTNLTTTVNLTLLAIPSGCGSSNNLNSALTVDGLSRVWLTRASSVGVWACQMVCVRGLR